ncbi:unnamed protein product, partial [Tetraodon nigroviridis]
VTGATDGIGKSYAEEVRAAPGVALAWQLTGCCPQMMLWSACLSVCLPVCLPACLPACLPVCLPVCLSACLSVCLSACLSDRLSACLPV